MTSPVPPRTPSAGADLPDDLRRRILEASLAKRPPGRATPAPPPITPLTAFERATDAFARVLSELSDAEWARPAVRGLDVQGLVGHLIGVERDVQRSVARDPDVAHADHVRFTQDAADAHRGVPPSRTHQAWLEAVSASREAFAAADPLQPLAVHTMKLHVASLLVLRTFELWAHENDIRRATGREARVPDDSTLALMTDLAARGLPLGAERIGVREPVALRLVLTGPGGGTWDVHLGPDAGQVASVGIVTDAVAFCRLAANRLGAADLDIDARGDLDRVDEVLAATAALALD